MQNQPSIPAPRGIVITWRVLALVGGALVVAAAIAIPLWQFVFTGSSSPAAAPKISFHYPKGWTFAPRSAWAGLGAPSTASAVLTRTGNSAVLVVLRGGSVDVGTKAKATAEADTLNAQLKKQYSDYSFSRAQRLKLPHTGEALFFSFVRTTQGVLHTITVIPAGRISYRVETASPPQNKTIGAQISAILRSATLQ